MSIALTIAICVIATLFLYFAVILAVKFYDYRKAVKRSLNCIELTPPSSARLAPEATARLFSILHEVSSHRRLKERLIRKHSYLSFEIVSTKTQGIRYLIVGTEEDIAAVRRAVISYLPNVQIADTSDYLVDQPTSVTQLTQTGHFAFPLKTEDRVDVSDPISYLTGAMTKLEANELVGLQVVISPIRPPSVKTLSKRILANEDVVYRLKGKHFRGLKLLNSGLFALTSLISDMTHAPSKQTVSTADRNLEDKKKVAEHVKPARMLTTFEQELVQQVQRKLEQPLFSSNIRLLIAAQTNEQAQSRNKALLASVSSFNLQHYQALRPERRLPLSCMQRYRYQLATKRALDFRTNKCSILSASELGALFHFPQAGSQTEDLVRSHSRILPAPLSLKTNTNLDLVLGQNSYHGTETQIGLTVAERERHIYIIGGTGNGKTTMLQYGIVQDMQNGKGVAVLDPHGDMAETLLRHVPKDRMQDVIYFNPDDLMFPIGLNILELTPGLTGADLLREKDLVTESVISLFRKIFSEEDSGGHRIEYVLRNAVQTALTLEGSTLFTVFDLINDAKFRKGVVRGLESKDLRNFWLQEFGKAGDYQKVKMAAGITAKIGRFLFSASAKQILEQPKSSINFDELIDQGKILICNLSKGLLGEDTSELFGITILTKLQLATLRRARLQQADRTPFYIYVDEFQNFATTSFVQMLSEARKYKMYMVMAEQSTSQQQDHRTVNIILANVGTVVTFRSGNPMDERLMLPLFSPYIEEGEIANLASYTFYMRIAALKTQEPLSGQTLLLAGKEDSGIAKAVVDISRAKYGKSTIEKPPPIEVTETKKEKKTRIVSEQFFLPEEI